MTPFWVAAYLEARTVIFSVMRVETVSVCYRQRVNEKSRMTAGQTTRHTVKAVTFLMTVLEIVVPPRQAGLLSNRLHQVEAGQQGQFRRCVV